MSLREAGVLIQHRRARFACQTVYPKTGQKKTFRKSEKVLQINKITTNLNKIKVAFHCSALCRDIQQKCTRIIQTNNPNSFLSTAQLFPLQKLSS